MEYTNQGSQHFPDCFAFAQYRRNIFSGNEPYTLGEQDVSLDLFERALCDAQKLDVLTTILPAIASAMFAGTEAAARRI